MGYGIFFSLEGSFPTIPTAALLFIMYTAFSWSIAFLIFLLESSRLKLLKKDKPHLIARLLAFYGLLAILLAIVTSPWVRAATWQEVGLILGLSLTYCYTAGWGYSTMCLKHEKQSS